MTKLVIEDVNVDLDDANIQINYSIAKIGEIDTRSGARSAEIQLPKTANNRNIFENTDDLTSVSLKPYRRLKARLYVNGIDQRILFASLESITDTYNIRVYGENVSFYDIIKARKAHETDLKEYDHFRTFANIKNGRSLTEGYLYPVIDYHSDSPNLYFDNTTARAYVQYLYPAPYYETVIQKIVEQAGYTLDNRLLDLPNYPPNGICLPYSSVPFRRNSDMRRYDGVITIDAPQAATGSFLAVNYIDTIGYDYKYWSSLTTLTAGLLWLDVITCDLLFEFELENTTGSDLIFQLDYTDNTGSIFFESFTIPASTTITHTKSFIGYQTQGFFEVLNKVGGATGSVMINSATITISNSELVTFDETIQYNNGRYSFTTINSLLPDVTQSKLLSNYLQMFLGMISVNETTKTVTLFSFAEIAKSINQGKDWSDKIDLTETGNKQFTLGYAQINNLTYLDDQTVIKPFGTDGTILIDDENLEAEDTMIKLDFAASEQVERLNGEYTTQIKMWSNVGSADAAMEEVKQRIAIVRFKDFSFDYTDGGTTQTVTTDVPLPYFIDQSNTLGVDINLGFDNNLIDYYQSFIQVLDKSKIITVRLRLNAIDINQLDFTKPIFIKHFNSWFYISEIKGYNPNVNESTECELVKLF